MRYNRIIAFVITVFLMQVASAQKEDKKSDKPVTISGYVMNQDEIPVRGAVFYIDNVRTSYITNTDGSYKIKVSPSAVKLKVLSSEFGEAGRNRSFQGRPLLSPWCFSHPHSTVEGAESRHPRPS